MSSICGLVGDKNNTLNIELQKMLNKLNHWEADNIGSWAEENVALGHLMLYNTPESKNEILPYLDLEANLFITADARIDNRVELAKYFDLNEKSANLKADSWYILTAYKKWGNNCVNYLEGDFVFAIWDKSKQQLFCARDRIGIKPFFYYLKDNFIAFASEMKGILALSNIDKQINKEWIGDYLMNIRLNSYSTFYKNILRLEPAHFLIYKNGEIEFKKYWELDTNEKIVLPKEEDYIETFIEKYESAIEKRIRSDYSISSELSGGLDSSSITSISHLKLASKSKVLHALSDVMPQTVPSSSFELLDDRKLINDVIGFVGLKNHSMLTGDEKPLLETIERAINIHDEPPREFLNVFFDLMIEKAQTLNSRVLLSGFGGDDVVSCPGYFFHEELFLQGRWKKLWSEISLRSKFHGTNSFRRLARIMSHAIFQETSMEKTIGRLVGHKSLSFEQKLHKTGIREDFAREMKLKDRFNESLNNGLRGNTVETKIASRISHPKYLPLRLEYGSLSTLHSKIEYRYPLLDVPLMQFFTQIPSTEKIKNGQSRYFFRNAIKNLVPESVIDYRNSKGNTTPSTLWRKYRDSNEMLMALKEITKNDAIQEYVDVNEIINKLSNNQDSSINGTSIGIRVLFLHRKLQRINL